jgi:hypothetical protein
MVGSLSEEGKRDLIAVLGPDKPYYINPRVQTISDGKGWTTLLAALQQLYPGLEFETDQRVMSIRVK